MKYEIEVEGIPDGYEPVRFGLVKTGEHYLVSSVVIAECDSKHIPQLIIRKVKRWRAPTLPADVGKVCRYSDDGKMWYSGATLRGWDTNNAYPWKLVTGFNYKYCEVEDDSGTGEVSTQKLSVFTHMDALQLFSGQTLTIYKSGANVSIKCKNEDDAAKILGWLTNIADDTDGDPVGWEIVAVGNDGSVLCQSKSGRRVRYWFTGERSQT